MHSEEGNKEKKVDMNHPFLQGKTFCTFPLRSRYKLLGDVMILMILLGAYLPTAFPSIFLTTVEEVLEVESDVNVSPGKEDVS